MLGVIYEELMGVFIACVTEPLDGLLLEKCLGIAESAKAKTVGPEVLGKVALRDARRPGLEHQDVRALLAQDLRYPATARSGADYDDVVGLRIFFHHF